MDIIIRNAEKKDYPSILSMNDASIAFHKHMGFSEVSTRFSRGVVTVSLQVREM